jgi:Protein of unknown function (DUF3443)
MSPRPDLRRVLAACLALCTGLILAACGGGGGGSPAPAPVPVVPQPTVTLAASAATVAGGEALTLTWSAQNTGTATCTASGAWSGQVAASGSQQVTPAVQAANYTATYTLTCGQASNSVAVAVTPPANVIPVVVDAGPTATRQFNLPFVSVTVCRPGTTTCQTIDHVLLDTGSYGLRLVAPLDGALALPAVTTASGASAGECAQFISGYSWGAVVQADVRLGGATAAAQSVQLIGQAPGGVSGVPAACSSTGASMNTVAELGANGVLGVGLFKEDCGAVCASNAIAGTYYACANGTCQATAMPLAQQVANPVAAFAADNNGIVIALPAVGTGGVPSLAGTLTFGIGTQANNAPGGATRYAADANGHFTTIYKGTTLTSSFIDSGSNGLFFNDAAIPKCSTSTDFYCPPTPLSLSATVMGYDGSTSGTVAFTIENIDTLPGNAVAGWVGGPYDARRHTGNAFDWGLPFFFGRKVYVGFATNPNGPYWAF